MEGEETTGAAADRKPAAPPVDTAQLRKDAESAGYAQAAEVLELCELAGHPKMAGDFIRAKAPMAEVRTKLREAKAAESAKPGEIRSGTMGADATDPGDKGKANKSLKTLMQERGKREGWL